jgi:peptide/nickel transport system permease protein
VITVSTTLGWMILETAGLSFLGLGAQPPQADLGSMLGEGRKLMFVAPHVTVLPGLVIFVLVMAINLTGDALRDVLDPRLRAGVLGRPAPRTQIRTATIPETKLETNPAMLLQVQGLQTSITQGVREYAAVQDVSFELAHGECLGLVGESGSGKTLSALSLTGLVASPPGVITGGAAYFDGRNLFTLDDEHIRQLRGGAIAHVFQDSLSALHPLFTVGEQLIEAIQAHQPLNRQQARQLAIELLERVRIPQPARRLSAYPQALSGGMRQRLSIAMALANRPKLIIADEPTTALDVTVQAQVLRQFDQLRREYETAVLFITHDFAVVSQIADRVAVMYAGRIVENGITADVMNKPAHPYTRMLLDCVPQLGTPGREIQAIPGQPPVLSEPLPGCAFAPRCAYAQEKCHADEPASTPLDGSRQVRCHFPLTEEA